MRTYLATWFIMAALALNTFVMPYADATLSSLEILSLTVIAMTLNLGFLFPYAKDDPNNETTLVVIILALNFIVILVFMYHILKSAAKMAGELYLQDPRKFGIFWVFSPTDDTAYIARQVKNLRKKVRPVRADLERLERREVMMAEAYESLLRSSRRYDAEVASALARYRAVHGAYIMRSGLSHRNQLEKADIDELYAAEVDLLTVYSVFQREQFEAKVRALAETAATHEGTTPGGYTATTTPADMSLTPPGLDLKAVSVGSLSPSTHRNADGPHALGDSHHERHGNEFGASLRSAPSSTAASPASQAVAPAAAEGLPTAGALPPGVPPPLSINEALASNSTVTTPGPRTATHQNP
jgi:hypothetical protein